MTTHGTYFARAGTRLSPRESRVIDAWRRLPEERQGEWLALLLAEAAAAVAVAKKRRAAS